MAMITMSHPDIAGTATATEEAFYAVWEPLDWELVDPETPVSHLPASMHWAGDWNSARNYEPGDGVEIAGQMYVALQTNRNKTPASWPAFWEAISGAAGGVLSVNGQTGVVDLSGTYAGNAQLAALLDVLITGAITRDVNGAATSAPASWPDGATGTYTALVLSSAFPGAVDSYRVTHVVGGTTITYTQPSVTRDATGAVTVRPAITVA